MTLLRMLADKMLGAVVSLLGMVIGMVIGWKLVVVPTPLGMIVDPMLAAVIQLLA